MLRSQVADLCRLFVEEGLGGGDVVIDEFLVLDVDERREEGEGCGEQGETPGGGDFDEEVGD